MGEFQMYFFFNTLQKKDAKEKETEIFQRKWSLQLWVLLKPHQEKGLTDSGRTGIEPRPLRCRCSAPPVEQYISDEFHTDKSRIMLNGNGAVITKFFYSLLFHMDFNTALFRRQTRRRFFYSLLFHMDFNTALFRRPTRRWSTHQLSSIQTEASFQPFFIRKLVNKSLTLLGVTQVNQWKKTSLVLRCCAQQTQVLFHKLRCSGILPIHIRITTWACPRLRSQLRDHCRWQSEHNPRS